MTTRRALTAGLTRRLVADIREGVPSTVAARRAGVSLETFSKWMTASTPRYRRLQAAVDQAEADAIADKLKAINKAIKRGKTGAAKWWLERQAREHFPPRAGTIVNNNNFLALLKQLKDSRVEAERERRDELEGWIKGPDGIWYQPDEPPAPVALPEPVTSSGSFVPMTSVVDPSTLPAGDDPSIIEMVRALPGS